MIQADNTIFDSLVFKPTKNNTLVLAEPYIYKDIVVPAGFETNGEDSPRWSWPLGFPPFKPLYAPAFVVHDYMLEQDKSSEGAKKANTYWAELMLKAEDSKKVRIAVWCMDAYWKYVRRVS